MISIIVSVPILSRVSLAIPDMIENKFGRIINISSVIGQSGGFGQTNYAAAKAAFEKALTKEITTLPSKNRIEEYLYKIKTKTD